MNTAIREVTAAAMMGIGRISSNRAARGAAATLRAAVANATKYQGEAGAFISADALLELAQQLEEVE
jgi:hypothetical protein